MHSNTFSANRIRPRVHLGDLQSAKNLPPSITHVISVMSKQPSLHPNGSKRKRLFICAKDEKTQDLLLKFGTCYDFIRNALTENNTNQVLIHCHAGKSRSATIAMMYLMRTYSYDYRKAKKYLEKKRPIIAINSGFRKQLRLFSDLLKHHNEQLYRSCFNYKQIFGTKKVKKPVTTERKSKRSSSCDSSLPTLQPLAELLVLLGNLQIYEQGLTP